MASNLFAPPQTDISGNISDLITQYRKQQALAKAQQLIDQRKSAFQQILSGGQTTDPLKAILGYGQSTGDIEGMGMLAKAVKLSQPATAKLPLGYQSAAGGGLSFIPGGPADPAVVAQLAGAKPTKPPEEPPDVRSFRALNPEEPGSTIPAISAAEAPGAAPAPPMSEADRYLAWKGKLARAAKEPSPEDKQKHYDMVSNNIDQARQTVDQILEADKKPISIFGNSALDTATGLGASLPSPGGGPKYNVEALMRQLQGQAKLQGFQDLKEAALNGSTGLARVAVIEFNAIGDLSAALDPRQGKEQYIQQLGKFKTWLDAVQNGLDKAKGGSPSQVSAPQTTDITKTSAQTATSVPGTTELPPIAVTEPAAATPNGNLSGASYQDKVRIGKQLARQGLNQDQIIQWFAARGVKVSPNE